MVHGYAAHCGLYRHVGAALAGHGFAVTAFDCRGHGRSGGRRGFVRRFDEYLDDLQAVADRAQGLTPGPLVLLGHSHGATIALDLVLRRKAQPHRLVVAAPFLALAMAVPGWKRVLGGAMASVWPTLAMANGIRAEDVSRNQTVLDNFWLDPLAHHIGTARWFAEVRAAQGRILAAAAQLRVKTLLITAGQDRIVSTEEALRFAAAAGPIVQIRRYDALFHELFLEPERDQVIDDIAAWLRAGILSRGP